MKKGFTLIEMLIVVVVLVTLMTMTFRLSSIGSNSSARNTTINRMQRLENCLSGYYAAYGSYPAVKLHGSRNIYLSVNANGIQDEDGAEKTDIFGWYDAAALNHGIGNEKECQAWEQVEAACRSQPVAFRFPFPDEAEWNTYIAAVSQSLKTDLDDQNVSAERKHVLEMGFSNLGQGNLGALSTSASDWREVQLFKFGLMSFLLPRYMVGMNGEENLFTRKYQQWEVNNDQAHDPFTDEAMSWAEVRRCAEAVSKTRPSASERDDAMKIANMPSQAVTARWMPNLEKTVSCNYNFRLFGVDISDGDTADLSSDNGSNLEIYSTSGSGEGGTYYVLDGVTVKDGWHNEFFYYSPPPYQSYTLWSAGPNGRTFPPWISRKALAPAANQCVSAWIVDDIVKMSN